DRRTAQMSLALAAGSAAQAPAWPRTAVRRRAPATVDLRRHADRGTQEERAEGEAQQEHHRDAQHPEPDRGTVVAPAASHARKPSATNLIAVRRSGPRRPASGSRPRPGRPL